MNEPSRGKLRIRCPHCHHNIELLDDDPSADVSCPSCGSCFNLARDDQTVTQDGSRGKMLGAFQLLQHLGQGAFGSVWKARDTRLDRTVAIKIPRNAHLSDGDAEKFFREARAAAQVRHPNIVSVHEVGREDGHIYIASDYVEGASLDQWIEAHPLTVRESVELCAKIAEALHHAHEAGVVHRDLKPQNILIDMSGKPHITDFGLAKRDAGEITMTVEGAIIGTPAYMPPEQARGEAHNADRRSDVYSLGVILYRLLTGELPFRGRSQMLLVQILQDEPLSLRKLDARLPRDVETICLKCLQKAPERRYQSAVDLAMDLRHWLAGEPITARPVSGIERSWRWCTRNRRVASLLTLSMLLLVAVALIATIAWKHETESTNEIALALDEKNKALDGQRITMQELSAANKQIKAERDHAGSLRDESLKQSRRVLAWHLLNEVADDNIATDLKQLLTAETLELAIDDPSLMNRARESAWQNLFPKDPKPLLEPILSSKVSLRLGEFAVSEEEAQLIHLDERLAVRRDSRSRLHFNDTTSGNSDTVVVGNEGKVLIHEWSGDSKWLAAGLSDGQIALCDPANRAKVMYLQASQPDDQIYFLKFGPQSDWLAALDTASHLHVVKPGSEGENEPSIRSVNLEKQIRGDQAVVTFLANHSWVIVSATDGSYGGSRPVAVNLTSLETVDLVTPQKLRLTSAGILRALSADASGTSLFTMHSSIDSQSIKVFDISDSGPLEVGSVLISDRDQLGLTADPKGQYAITFPVGFSVRDGGTIRIWVKKPIEGWNSQPAVLSERVNMSGVAPDGRLVVASDLDNRLLVWRRERFLKNDLAPEVLAEFSEPADELTFAPDGRWLVRVGKGKGCDLWQIDPDGELRRGPFIAFYPSVAMFDGSSLTFSANSRWLLINEPATSRMRLFDLNSDAVSSVTLDGVTGRISPPAFDKGGTRLAAIEVDSLTDERSLTIRDLESLETAQAVRFRQRIRDPAAADSISVSPDGSWIATGHVEIRSLDSIGEDGESKPLLQVIDESVRTTKISPNRHWLIAGRSHGAVELFRLTGGLESAIPVRVTGHPGAVTSVDFSPDSGSFLVGDSGGRVSFSQIDESADKVVARQQTVVSDTGSFVRDAVIADNGAILVEFPDRIASFHFDDGSWKPVDTYAAANPSCVRTPNNRWCVVRTREKASLVCVLPDGKFDEVRTWEHSILKNVRPWFSEDNKWLATNYGGELSMHSLSSIDSGSTEHSIDPGFGRHMTFLKFSPNGRWLAYQWHESMEAVIVDLQHREFPRWVTKGIGNLEEDCSVFSPDSNWLLLTGDRGPDSKPFTRLLNMNQPREDGVQLPSDAVIAASFDNQSTWLALIVGEYQSKSILLQTLAEDNVAPRTIPLLEKQSLQQLSFSTDGKWLNASTKAGALYRFPVVSDDDLDNALRHQAGRKLTKEERLQYLFEE